MELVQYTTATLPSAFVSCYVGMRLFGEIRPEARLRGSPISLPKGIRPVKQSGGFCQGRYVHAFVIDDLNPT
jgi:hypothetical protein